MSVSSRFPKLVHVISNLQQSILPFICILIALPVIAQAQIYGSTGVPTNNCLAEHPTMTLTDFRLGETGTITIQTVPNTLVYVVGATSDAFIPVGENIFFNLTTYLEAGDESVIHFSAFADASGTATIPINIPNDPQFIGEIVGFQAISVEAACFATPAQPFEPFASSALITAELTSTTLQTATHFQIGEIEFYTASPTQYGYYVTGDMYLVKPFQIVSVTPEPEFEHYVDTSSLCDSGQWAGEEACPVVPGYDRDCQWIGGYSTTGYCHYYRVRNGASLNHTQDMKQTFDSRAKGLPENPVITFPYTAEGDGIDSIILTSSQPESPSSYCLAHAPANLPFQDHTGGCTWAKVNNLIVVTAIPASEIPTGPEFRPPYPGTSNTKRRYPANNLNIPNAIVPPTSSAPSFQQLLRSIDNTWLVTGGAEGYTQVSPANNMRAYGANIAIESGDVMLSLLRTDLSESERKQLLYHIVQIGIDFAHAFWQGGTYAGGGGHGGSGRLFNTVLAAHVLGDNQMAEITLHPRMETDFSPVSFSYYDHPSRSNFLGIPDFPRYGPSGTTTWAVDYAQALVDPSRDYFDCCSVSAWFGEVAAMRFLGLEAEVRDPDIFDLINRFFNEDRSYGYHSDMAMEMWEEYAAPAPFQQLLCNNNSENRCHQCDGTQAEYTSLSALQNAEPLPGAYQMHGEVPGQVDCGPACGNTCGS